MPPWTIELASDVCPEVVQWLYPGFLARGKVSVLDGDPGMGKSLITLDLTARLSRGGPLPDGTVLARAATAVILSAEDGLGDTVRPRLEAAGADLSRVVLPRFADRVPRLPNDLPDLEELIRASTAELVVLDPLMAFLPPNVAANLDQCVRRALTPLASVAERTGCAVLLVRHLTKRGTDRAIYRGQGSIGILAAARVNLMALRHPAVPGGGVLAVSKNNLASSSMGLGYRVVDSPMGLPVVEWAGPVDLSADALCRAGSGGIRARDRATDWLRRELAGGPRPAAALFAAAAEADIPEATLKRAKQELGARSQQAYDRREQRGEWYWYDPSAAWPENAPFRKPRELAPLDPL